MTDDRRSPHLTDKARSEAEAKRARQAAALRENLLRRKAQARARADQPERKEPQGSGS